MVTFTHLVEPEALAFGKAMEMSAGFGGRSDGVER